MIGEKEVYASSEAGIAACCRSTVGIVCRSADAALTPTLRLRWSWRLDELPSRLPEDTALTHDYLSVALEFDDGQDLTWHWSCSLPPGFAYRCPLEHWRHRETHIVAHSGTADLGRWLEEERPVLADHQVAIGGPAPARVRRGVAHLGQLLPAGRGARGVRTHRTGRGRRRHPRARRAGAGPRLTPDGSRAVCCATHL